MALLNVLIFTFCDMVNIVIAMLVMAQKTIPSCLLCSVILQAFYLAESELKKQYGD